MSDELYNIAFEKSVLSSFIFHPEKFSDLSELLIKDDFYLPAHQNIFTVLKYLDKNNMPIDEEFIKKELVKSKEFDEQVMLEILVANPISNLNEYINTVKELSNHRRLLKTANDLRSDISLDEKLTLVKSSIEVIESSVEAIEDIGCDVLLQTRFENRVTYDTGLSPINNSVGSLEKGQLIYVTGAEETGKTHLTYKMMENLSVGHKVGIISLEFGKRKLKDRLSQMVKNNQPLNPANIKASFESHNIIKIEKLIRKWVSEGVGFIVLDSFNLVENLKSSDTHANVIDTGRRLFKLTQQLDFLLMVISTSTKIDHKEGNPSIYGGQLLNHYCDQKWHILRDLETEERLLWVNKNKQNYKYGKEKLYFRRDGSISSYDYEQTEFKPEPTSSISMAIIN